MVISRGSKGDIKTFSRKPGAVHRWVITTHECAAIARLLTHLKKTDRTAANVKPSMKSGIALDDKSVVSLLSLLEAWQDPFRESSELININLASQQMERSRMIF